MMQSIRFSIVQVTLALLIVAITLFAATQWAAAMLETQSARTSDYLDEVTVHGDPDAYLL